MASQKQVNDLVPTPGGIFGGIGTGKIPRTRSSKAIAGISIPALARHWMRS
jgi:hypothetical protein